MTMKSKTEKTHKGDILVVDDTVPNLRLLSGMLTGQGYKVRGVPSGPMALTAVHSAAPDLILLDINMPEMNGYEVCEKLKASVESRGIPVIFVSALDETLDKVRAFQVGAVDYVSKPFQLEEVLARVENHLNLRALQKELQLANDKLEQRVKERTIELQETVELLKDEIAERQRAQREKSEIEAQLYQSQKMEALGRLAGGVAHDFNNFLTVVICNADVLLSAPLDEERLKKKLELIRQTGMKAASLTQQLLAFSKGQVIHPKVLDLNEVVQEMEGMVHSLVGRKVKVSMSLDSSIGKVKVDPTQISQVILNLAVNARDAMPNGGALSVVTANIDVNDTGMSDFPEIEPGAYVRLTVTDTGLGMDEKTQRRIFEPFYTTKAKDKGTGLGLSTVLGIVSQSDGSIQVLSEPNKGTEFRVYFPRTEPSQELRETRPSGSGEQGGGETILVVDDDPDLRSMLSELLQQNGHKVLEASDGSEALEVRKNYSGSVDLLLTDVAMPLMGGIELADWLARLSTETKVLFITSYVDSPGIQGLLDKSGFAFLQKPFTCEILMAKLREVLDQS